MSTRTPARLSTSSMRRASFMATEAAFITRGLRHATRNAEALLVSLMLPVMIMLAFVVVFGGAIETGTDYVNYVVPGIILLCAGFGAAGTATGVALDKVNGVIDRFRTMPIRSSAVLTGHVVSSLARNLVATAIVFGVAMLLGFRPTPTPLDWLGVVGTVVLFILAMTWLSTAIGLAVQSVEAANAFGFFVMFVPYVSSGFVPTETMPSYLQWFADHQPVTPIIETLRGLLTGTPIDDSAWWAVGWCLLILIGSFVWAASLFRRHAHR